MAWVVLRLAGRHEKDDEFEVEKAQVPLEASLKKKGVQKPCRNRRQRVPRNMR
jgi:hypothetical protein